jgi:hypothetical protein
MIPRHRANDSMIGRWALVTISAIAVLLGGYYWYRSKAVAPEPAPPPAITAAEPPPAIVNPIEPSADLPPLPALGQSDDAIADVLVQLFGSQPFEALFASDDIIRRITVTVDNLPRDKVAVRQRPLKPMGSSFIANGEEGGYSLGPDNYVRYEPYVAMIEQLDTDAATLAYVRFYPLFQKAYQELGNLDGYFNDRVVKVIDHLLATPEIAGPIALERPSVMYRFADPDLEARSAGQKLLLRMGPANAARVKAKLKSFRERIATEPPPG